MRIRMDRVASVALLSTSCFRKGVGLSPKSMLAAAAMSTNQTFDDARLSTHVFRQHAVGSTQDEARKLLKNRTVDDGRFLVVIANAQNQGRGTQGRRWEGGTSKGNLYTTLCVPIKSIPVMMTLLPLQIGVLVASLATKLLQACRQEETLTPKVTVKWPNDVLINDRKLAGVLIENEIIDNETWLLVGVGVNLVFAPNLSASPGKQIRGATCLQDLCREPLPESTFEAFGRDLSRALVDWILDDSVSKDVKEKQVVDEWKSFAEFGHEYEIRGEVQEEHSGYRGEKVVVLDVQKDGQLVVRGADGRERLLIADYMF